MKKKLQTYLIHCLGGFTRQDCAHLSAAHSTLATASAYRAMRKFTERMNGLSADEWCKTVYNFIVRCDEDYKEVIHANSLPAKD